MESKPMFKPDRGLELMDQVRQVMRYHHYAYPDLKTTEIYTHVMQKDVSAVVSPLDCLEKRTAFQG